MSLAKQYTTEIAQGLQYLPIWLPINTISIGDYGTIKDNSFERMGNLAQMNIPFTRARRSSTGTMRYYSQDGVSIFFKAVGTAPLAGSALSAADAGFIINFSRSKVVVFEASGCKVEAITDLYDLGQTLIRRYQSNNWNEEFYVITEVVLADAATILISKSSGASIEIKATGKIGANAVSLADAEAGLKAVSTASMGMDLVAEKNLS